MEGTIKFFEAKIDSRTGQQRQYETHGKNMYVFNITIATKEGEKKGEVSSTSIAPKWQVGDEVEFNYSEGEYGGKIKGMKKKDGFTKSNYNDPQVVKLNAASMGMKISTLAFDAMKKHILSEDKAKLITLKSMEDYGAEFYDWIIKTDLTRDATIFRYHCLEHAIDSIGYVGIEINTKDDIIEIAERYRKHIVNISKHDDN